LHAKRKRTPGGSAATEERLLEAVEELMRSQGLARITTRDIARAAGLAEGTLYNHFRDKDEIFIAVLKRNVAEFAHVVQDLPLRVGQATVLENLQPVAEAAAGFHIKAAPLICSLLADQKLLAETRRRMQELRIGPQRSLEALAAYIAAEQRLGRITSESDAAVVAGLILGTSFHMAVLDHFSGRSPDEGQARARMRHAIQALVAGLTPRAAQDETSSTIPYQAEERRRTRRGT
jgi:AcrR family transcriptional regulator